MKENTLFFFTLSSFMPESLRWLTVKGKLDEAENVVAYICHINGSVVPENCRGVLEVKERFQFDILSNIRNIDVFYLHIKYMRALQTTLLERNIVFLLV